jgi:hypothetical protein
MRTSVLLVGETLKWKILIKIEILMKVSKFPDFHVRCQVQSVSRPHCRRHSALQMLLTAVPLAGHSPPMLLVEIRPSAVPAIRSPNDWRTGDPG